VDARSSALCLYGRKLWWTHLGYLLVSGTIQKREAYFGLVSACSNAS
jgi:hypothetical protein